MKEIDEYIDSLYKNSTNKFDNIVDIKNDMKSHLVETVEELKREGKSESESIKIAINRFGEVTELRQELGPVLGNPKINFRFILLLSILSLLLIATTLILLAISSNGGATLNGPATIFMLPIYLIIRCIKLKSNRKFGLKTNVSLEIYMFIFMIYIAYIIGRSLFPINVWPYFEPPIFTDIQLLPGQTIIYRIQVMTSARYNYLPLSTILLGFLKYIALYLPLGFFVPLIWQKFRNIKRCILLSSIVHIGIILIHAFLVFIGISSSRYLSVSFDYLVLSIIGTLSGYLLYYKLRNILP